MSHYLFPALILLCSPFAFAADKLATYEDTIRAAPLPAGHQLVTREEKEGEKLLARFLVVAKEEPGSSVVITVENRKLPTDAHRVAAVKGYVNGHAKSLRNAGYQIVRQDLPDLDKTDFSQPVITKLELKNSAGKTAFLEIRALVARVGCSVVVFATSPEDQTLLGKWASTVLVLDN